MRKSSVHGKHLFIFFQKKKKLKQSHELLYIWKMMIWFRSSWSIFAWTIVAHQNLHFTDGRTAVAREQIAWKINEEEMWKNVYCTKFENKGQFAMVGNFYLFIAK